MRLVPTLLVLTALPLHAATTHTVTVGAGQFFTPSSITIRPGDSVRFRSLGGLHNVKANDNSWRCAFGCDGEGGNGNPSNSLWMFTRTFTTVGTVGYYCETHGTPSTGMRGTIIVDDTTPVQLQEFRVD